MPFKPYSHVFLKNETERTDSGNAGQKSIYTHSVIKNVQYFIPYYFFIGIPLLSGHVTQKRGIFRKSVFS